MPYRALLFDLSGVLVDIQGPESLHALSGGRLTRQDFFRFWSESPWAHRIHLGACTPAEFAAGAVAELALPVTPDEFLASFRAWLQGPYPGALELVAPLRRRRMVACLSNAHELDVARFRTEFGLDRFFDRCFFSNEMRLRKPDPASYRHALDELGVEPGETAFFDDGWENVEGARAVGIHAFHTDGLAALRDCLRDLRLLG